MNRPAPGINFNAKLITAFEEEIIAAREGYRFAQQITLQGKDPMSGVNSCPYGPAWPENDQGLPVLPLVHAWYQGWWFWWYVVLPWSDLVKKEQ